MKTFIMPHDSMLLNIRNFERVPEKILLKQIVLALSKKSDFEIFKRIQCPSEDLYNCKFRGNEFIIIDSLDDGVSLRFDNKDTLQEVESILDKI